jgi:hypothetical protein
MKEQMRAEFEACYKKKHKNCDMPQYQLGGYKLVDHEIAWEMWQAALSAVPANHKLTQAVNALAAQTGESAESLTEWLSDKGGLTQLMLSHFGGMSQQVKKKPEESIEERLFEIAHEYWNIANKKHSGAVQWIRDDESGASLFFTRGEYANEILAAVMDITSSSQARQQNHIPDGGDMVRPIAYRFDWQAEYALGMPKFFGADNMEAVNRYSKMNGVNVVPLYLQSQAQQEQIAEEKAQDYWEAGVLSREALHEKTEELNTLKFLQAQQDHIGDSNKIVQEPYAYDVPTEDGTELAYAIYFTKYNNPLPEGAIPLYLQSQAQQPAQEPVKQERWISVEARLPKKYENVLVHPSPTEYCLEAHWDGKSWVYGHYETHNGHVYETLRDGFVTHWMPLPLPPFKGSQP